MNKNLRVGILASLLLVPGAIVHANEDIGATNGTQIEQAPYNTFATVSKKDSLTTTFGKLDETYSVENIAYYRTLYNEMLEKPVEKDLFTAEELALIDEKIRYLEAFATYKSDATSLNTLLSKLTDTSKTLIADTKTAQTNYTELLANINTTTENLFVAADSVVDTAFSGAMVQPLKNYNQSADFFVEGIVTNLATYTKYIDLIDEPDTFITTSIAPIIALNNTVDLTTLDASAYKTAVEDARLAYDELETNEKSIVGYQTVAGTVTATKVLTNAETDIEKAAVVEKLLTDIENATFTSATTFKSKVSSATTAYEKLTPLQKALVQNYDVLSPLKDVIAVVDAITALRPATTQAYRDKLAEAEKLFDKVTDTSLKAYITNGSNLAVARENVYKAIKVEELIEGLTKNTAHEVKVPTALEIIAVRTAYNALKPEYKKVVLQESYAELQLWEKNNTSAAAVVKQIDTIVVSSAKTFTSKVYSAQAAYMKLGDGTNQQTAKQQLVFNYSRLALLLPYAEKMSAIENLKVTDVDYNKTINNLYTNVDAWVIPADASDAANLTDLKADALASLDTLKNEAEKAITLKANIEQLKTMIDLTGLSKARTVYNDLSSTGKKIVTNINDLTALEKEYKTALNVENLIIKLPVFTDKGYAKKVVAIETAYKKVPQNLQTVITSYESLTGTSGLLAIAKSMIEIDGLKATAKDFTTKVTTARTNYNLVAGSTSATLDMDGKPVAAIDYFITVYGPKLTEKEGILDSSSEFDAEITALKALTGASFMSKLEDLTNRYKKLSSDVKKNVAKAKDLTDLERDYKSALKVYNLIETLPANTDKTFAKKVDAAEKAYQKLTTTQKGYVYNYTTKLVTVLNVADLIGRIDALKISNKTYENEVTAIRAEYDVLSDTDKALVHNYKNLQSAESNMSDAQGVMTLIDAAIPNAEEYIAKLTTARAAYDGLDKTQQKLVLNYKELTTREKEVKPVLALDKQITELNTSNVKTFLSKYTSALKSYEKLTYADRGLLLSENQLTTVLQPLYNVIDQINSIKSSSKTFVSDTQSARAAYNALTAGQQAQIGNYRTLQDHELNVAGGANVDAFIRALSSSDPKEYVQKVKEARTAYNALSSANKKAVTLADSLKDEEKYVKPVETVIDLIEGLSNPRNDLSKQFDKVNAALKKLDAEQISFISNFDKYSDLSDVIFVYQLIAKLKPSDKYYLGNLQAAKLAYGKLSMEDKLRVTNYYKLQEAEQDVTEIERVTNVIGSLSSSSSTYFADIEAALAAYKTIPSASRKQVLNYTNLQTAEKNMKAAQKVMKSIEELDSSLRNFESKTKATKKTYEKLTDDQKKIVANYNLLQSYLFDLGL